MISRIHTISSGGQTGVDRAALDVAIFLGKTVKGWCPKGRWAEDGPLPVYYPLKETKSEKVEVRTEKNVRETDASLILAFRENYDNGSIYTIEQCGKYNKPILELDLSEKSSLQISVFKEWNSKHEIQSLNIGGPRESFSPGIYKAAYNLLSILFEPK